MRISIYGPSIQIYNSPQVIIQRDVNIQTTRNESSSLKKIVIVLGPSLFGRFTRQSVGRFGKSSILIDYGKLFNNVIVKAHCKLEFIIWSRYRDGHRLSIIKITPQPGGKAKSRSSAKQSGFNLPSLKVLILS